MKHLEDRLEAAVMNYVDGLPLDSLIEWVTNDVWQYYRKSADEEEVKTFIQEMETNTMRLLLNTEAYPDYTQDQLVEWLGILPHWVAEYAIVEDGDLVEHMTECYGFGSLYKFKGEVLSNGNYTSTYDDDLEPIAKMKLKKGDVYFYPHSMIALPTKDGHYVTRMD